MKKRLVAMLMATLMVTVGVTGCGNSTDKTTESTVGETTVDKAEESEETANPDQEAADKVAALIDAIYVQKRTDETDKQCAEAKAGASLVFQESSHVKKT